MVLLFKVLISSYLSIYYQSVVIVRPSLTHLAPINANVVVFYNRYMELAYVSVEHIDL